MTVFMKCKLRKDSNENTIRSAGYRKRSHLPFQGSNQEPERTRTRSPGSFQRKGSRPCSGITDIRTLHGSPGADFHHKERRDRYLKTAAQLNFAKFLWDIRSFDASGFDLVITDFEPISARIAKRHGIPSIGIGHQYAFMYDIPMAKGNPLGLFILRNFAPADHMLGLHWHHFDRPILPPIVPDHFKSDRAVNDKKILVYLPFEDLDEIENMLREFDTNNFHIYHGSCNQPEDKGNLHLRPFSREGFLRDLCECGGVICNAGFELPSEALHLGKRILAKPLSGQIEQKSNALALGQLGLATSFGKIEREAGQRLAGWRRGSSGKTGQLSRCRQISG